MGMDTGDHPRGDENINSCPNAILPESKQTMTKQHAVASMDADIERSNGSIIQVSSRNIDSYIFVVL